MISPEVFKEDPFKIKWLSMKQSKEDKFACEEFGRDGGKSY